MAHSRSRAESNTTAPSFRLLVSFATQPTGGSEPRVGWEYLVAHTAAASERGEKVLFIFDDRDRIEVELAVSAHQLLSSWVSLRPVDLPSWAPASMRKRRTRLSYMLWRLNAKRECLRLTKKYNVTLLHQVTFASALLPNALARRGKERVVWGPVAVPVVRAASNSRCVWIETFLNATANFVLRTIARANGLGVHTILVQNSASGRVLCGRNRLLLEPNVVVDPSDVTAALGKSRASRDEYFVVCGNLIERKRPEIALRALSRTSNRCSKLVFIGDGPLRFQLTEAAADLRLSDRVEFRGRLGRPEVLEVIGNASALIHCADREGAGWVVGEASALGVPAIVVGETGAADVLRIGGGSGVVIAGVDGEEELVELARAMDQRWDRGQPSTRWAPERLVTLCREL